MWRPYLSLQVRGPAAHVDDVAVTGADAPTPIGAKARASLPHFDDPSGLS